MSISVNNPIIQRELIGILRSRRALAAQIIPAFLFAALVIVRWPTDARVDLTGSQSRQVLQLFGYGVLATLLLVVPAFPATAIVRERTSGTLALVLNSPMNPWSIYFGKFLGALVFVFLPLVMSVPAAAACYAMGGVSLSKLIVPLYGLFALITVQYTALALCVSSRVNSTDSALRMTYAITLILAVVLIGPHLFLQGKDWGNIVTVSLWLRSVSPIPAVMELLGQGDVGGQGLIGTAGYPLRFALTAIGITIVAMLATIVRLTPSVFDKPRPQGVITDDRSTAQQWLRRLIFLVDPQRRTGMIGPLTNPIMVKEFRCRRFGRSHWLMRLVAVCAVASLGLTYASTAGTLDWGVKTIGGILVVLQVALLILLTPSLAAGLISSERETGGWTLLRMTPLSAGQIVRGKLMSAIWPLILILCATFPGYAVMIYIEPSMTQQITNVFFCLLLTALFALLASAAIGSLFQRTAPATVAAYVLLLGFCGGTMLFWLGRDSTFGHSTVETILTINPLAAALSVMQAPGFAQYKLVPTSWWFLEAASCACLVILGITTWRLTRPQ